MSTSSLTVWRFFLLVTCVFCSLSPTKIRLLREESSQLIFDRISSIPPSARLIPQEVKGLIEDDEMTLTVNAGQVSLWNAQKELTWQSAPEWKVSEAFFSDLNRDGEDELSLLVWRKYRPWPVEKFLRFDSPIVNFHDEDGRSCQLILMKWKNGSFMEAWAGSALAAPIHDLQALDLDGDGYQELAALEQPYNAWGNATSVVIWRWNGFGFSLDSRRPGKYTDLLTLIGEQNSWLVIR